MADRRLALGLSGGGDSLALLHALRRACPDIELHALIVDHGLRPQSAREAEFAQAAALKAGARAAILRWDQPRKGQAHARLARHRLLARACLERGLSHLCLGHTLDDRVETLRIRQSRAGGPDRLAGPRMADPSPVWPEGAGLVILRPFLGLRRDRLRRYLRALGESWLEDPSNEDIAYERVRVRKDAWPAGGERERALLALSDDVRAARETRGASAFALIKQAAQIAAWGGVKLDAAAFASRDAAIACLALETLVLAVSGDAGPPAPDQTRALLEAVAAGRAATVGGAMLTADGWLGRDPGAAAGRADGAPGAAPLSLAAGETGVFDGRWGITAHQPLRAASLGPRQKCDGDADIPAKLRPGLAALRDGSTGELLALPGVNAEPMARCELLAETRIEARLLSPTFPAWFDRDQCAREIEAGLANAAARPNINA